MYIFIIFLSILIGVILKVLLEVSKQNTQK